MDSFSTTILVYREREQNYPQTLREQRNWKTASRVTKNYS